MVKKMLQSQLFLISAAAINVLLLIFISPVAFGIGLVAALFGLPAYGSFFSHLCVFIFVVAAVTFPIAALLATISSFMLLAGKSQQFWKIGLTLPLPALLVFGIVIGSFLYSVRGDIARSINPQTAEDFERLGSIQCLSKNYKEAQKRFEQSMTVARTPQDNATKLTAIAGRAYVKAHQGDFDGSISDYRLYIKLAKQLSPSEQPQPPQAALLSIACVNSRAGRYNDALEICDEAAASSRCWGDLMQMLLVRSRVHESMGDANAAQDDLRLLANRAKFSELYPEVPKLMPEAERDNTMVVSKLKMDTIGFMSPLWHQNEKKKNADY
jgi:tetratricopeptide (TPR) repeat protein